MSLMNWSSNKKDKKNGLPSEIMNTDSEETPIVEDSISSDKEPQNNSTTVTDDLTVEPTAFAGLNTPNPKDYEPGSKYKDIDRFFSDDDEIKALNKAKGNNALTEIAPQEGNKTTRALEKSFKEYKQMYPHSSFKAAKFITADILLEADENYFDVYQENLKAAVDWTQTTIADKEMSDILAECKANPTDDALQEEAFKVVQTVAIEFLDRLSYRGIDREIMKALVANEIVGFSAIDPLWRDRKINEIFCNGPNNIKVEIAGKKYKVPSCKFRDAVHLENFLERLFGALNKKLSRTTPILKSRLHDNSRLHATHRVVAPNGPNVNIRRHPERFWEPADLVSNGSSSEEMMTYLGNLINKGCSFIVIGGTSTGKTSLLNAMTGFIKDDDYILTLEDSIEMLPNPRKMLGSPMECVAPATDNGNDRGVTMRDLVKASTQMAPDCIIVGEVRDSAAMDLVQALNTGHYGGSTVHANTSFDGVYRMASLIAQSGESTMEGALPLIAAAFDIIIHVKRYNIDGSRRISEIAEIAPFPKQDEAGNAYLPLNPLWRFKSEGLVDGKVTGDWVKVGEMSKIRSERRNLSIEPDLSWEELKHLSRIKD